MTSLPDITATPAANKHILHEGVEYTTIKEGLAHILVPASASATPMTTNKGDNQPQSVFYNPIQQFNRDLSVLAIKAFSEQLAEKKIQKRQENRERLAAKKAEKRAEKKRKREGENGLEDVPRKAGKLDESQSGELPSNEVHATTQATETAVGVEKTATEPTGEQDTTVSGENGTVPAVDGKDGQPRGPTKPNKFPKPEPGPPTFTILDALSATGLRALRYAQEIPGTTSITANDLLPTATKSIELNVKYNKLEDKIEAVTGNAVAHMYSLVGKEDERDEQGIPLPSKKYDVIDLDPYGTAAPFLDAAIQSVKDGGLLCVTCTDAGVWASNGYPEKAFSLYGGTTIRGQHSHEGGLRLILNSIATSAARYGLAMEPLLSLSIDFYARVFVRIHKSAADVKFLAGKTMVVYQCDTGCGAWETQLLGKNKLTSNKSGKGQFYKHVYGNAAPVSENCKHCGFKMHMAGPMYAGPIHSPDFIKHILDDLPKVSKDTYATTTRIEGMLSMALEETLPDPEAPKPESLTTGSKIGDPAAVDRYPFFFIPSTISKIIHCITPQEDAIRGALRHLGYRVTRSHCKGGSIKTNASWEVIWEIMREWVRQKHPVKESSVKEGTAGYVILGLDKKDKPAGEGASKPKIEVVFDEKLGREVDAKKLVRFQVNPRENWGPMSRAKGE
ncbi:tRNA (guanine(26)-N(2))-dimethyltransferase, mitochondrial [Phlyctema vagabunda]|uniref:tRNA (guanine(26)-N(2))-dimethyltransferase n=1 Tax=Phlyctema vagabunda TaxID=108571 RepID=A0ABR4P981_9HELO